jgi:peptide/nickel transport system substrate-binding protein
MSIHRCLVVWCVCLAVTALVGCAGAPPPASPQAQQDNAPPRQGGKIVYGLTLAPSGIDPHVNASSELGIPLRSVYDTLIYRALSNDPDGPQFVPGLAEKWETSQDGLTVTFHLRQDVMFHDDAPFNAQAVRASLERVLNPDTKSQKAVFLLGPVQSVEVVDDYTVALHLATPFAPLLDGLSQVYLGIASPRALAAWGSDYQFHQVGSGPFRFVEFVPNDHLTLVRNDAYRWGPPIHAHTGAAYLETVEFRFFTDPAGRAVALEAGDVDVMGELPPLDAARLQDDQRFAILPVRIPGQSLGIMLNTQRPPLDDLRVRRALLRATDREAIVKAVFAGRSPVADGPLTSATFGYTAAPVDQIGYDLQAARQLLQDAGYRATNADGVLEKDGSPLVLDAIWMTWGAVPDVAQLLQAQWADAGIGLRAETLTYPAALEKARQGEYHLIPQNFAGTDPDLLHQYYHSGSAFNWSRVADADLDAALDGARRSSDMAERLKLYAQAQARITELALLVPIREPVNLNGASARVQGLRFDAHGWFPILHDVSIQ